jgi:branched-chain amino acid transport system permease protein
VRNAVPPVLARPSAAAQAAGSAAAKPSRGRRRAAGLLALLGALLVALPFALNLMSGQREVYWLFVISQFFTLALVAVSLDLLMGRTGQISLGHNGFFAVGAYTAAILSARFEVDTLLAMAAAGIAAAIASLILGFPAARLRGHYLGIVTFGFGIAVAQIALKWVALTGGDQGIHLKPPKLFGTSIATPTGMYFLTLCVLVIAVFLVWNLTHTRMGRSFAAVRDSEVAAAAMGVPVARTKVIAFVCSAFLAGVAGCLYAFLAGFIAPEDFGIVQAMLFLAMVVIGGTPSIAGAIGGALVVDTVQHAASTVSGLSLAILGGVIVLVTLFFPYGLKGLFRRIVNAGEDHPAEREPERIVAATGHAPPLALQVADEPVERAQG